MKRIVHRFRLLPPRLPSPLWLIAVHTLVIIILAGLLIWVQAPDQLMILPLALLLFVAPFYPRWVYIVMLLILDLGAIWVVYYLSTSLVASLETIGALNLMFLVVAELLNSVMRARQAAEAALRESEERYRRLVEQGPDAILVHQQGRLVYANMAAAKLFGAVRTETLLGKTMIDLVHPNDREMVVDRIQKVEANKRIPIVEQQLIRLDGRAVEAEVAASACMFGGQPSVQVVIHDVTECRRAEKALRQYAAELKAQNEELDAFAHTVAHDLKNPLGALTGIADFLEERHSRFSDTKLEYYLQEISRSGRKATNIVDELLLLSTVRKQEARLHSLKMAPIIAEARQRLYDMIIEYEAKIVEPVSWPTAWGYAPWVEEVWVNFLSNGLKYGGQPPHLIIGATLQDDNMVRFWIQDNGPGLAVEDQARLFAPFTQLHQVRAQGHGLGLSIVRRIVEKLGGQVGVQSEHLPGRGSLFFFTLPAKPPLPESKSVSQGSATKKDPETAD